jgi:hypothetical protein
VELAADNLKASREQLAEAVSGAMQSRHRVVLAMRLEELDLLDQHIAELGRQLGKALLQQLHGTRLRLLVDLPVRRPAA